MVQLGIPKANTTTMYSVTAAEAGLPYRSVWRVQQTAVGSSMRFVPDLSVHLVYDLAGLIDVEPFLLYAGNRFIDLVLPAGTQLLGLQFPVWEALTLSEAETGEAALYSVQFDAEWAYLIYFTLLELRNTGGTPADELHQIGHFLPWIDASLRKDLRQHFMRVASQPQQAEVIAYSERHQRRLYHEFTALTPGQFKRILRFQQALQRMQVERRLSWDDYFDQAHYIREFKAFTGMTPAALLKAYYAYSS
jgi:AraC-like DNA-binding protein